MLKIIAIVTLALAAVGCATAPPVSKHGRLVKSFWVLPTGFTDSLTADAYNPKLQHHCVYENGVVMNIGRDPHCPR